MRELMTLISYDGFFECAIRPHKYQHKYKVQISIEKAIIEKREITYNNLEDCVMQYAVKLLSSSSAKRR
jgi:hypothetical protein